MENTAQALHFYRITEDDGLPSNTVWRMVQDEHGYLWVGTKNGLYRYDGQSFEEIAPEVFRGNSVMDVTLYDEGRLLANIFKKGLAIVETDSKAVVQEIQVQTHEYTFFDGKRSIGFLSGFGFRVGQLHTGSSSIAYSSDCFGDFDDVQLKYVHSFNGQILGATKDDFVQIKGNSILPYFDTSDKQEVQGVTAFYMNDSESWCAGKGFIAPFSKKGIGKPFDFRLPKDAIVHRLLKDTKGRFWLSVIGHGLFLVENGMARSLNDEMGLGDVGINSLFEDHQGNIWILTYGEGLVCVPNSAIRNYFQDGGLPSNEVTSFVYSRFLGKMIGGSSEGLFTYDSTGIERVLMGKLRDPRLERVVNPLSFNFIGRLAERQDGSIIVHSTNNDADWNFDGLRFRTFGFWFLDEKNDDFFGVIDENMTVAELQDKGEHWRNTALRNFQEFGIGTYSFIDFQGDVWYERFDNGLMFSNDKGTVQMDSSAILQVRDRGIGKISCHLNRKESSLIGTKYGLFEYDGERLTESSINNSLDGRSIDGLVMDNTGALWIGTNNGLCRYFSNETICWDKSDGLAENNINALGYDPVKNLLFVGTNVGMSLIDIARFSSSKTTDIPTAFTSFVNRGNNIEDWENVSLEYWNSDVKIGYTSLDFSKKTKKKFQYKLSGSSKGEWRNTDLTNIEFHALKSDDYKFELRAVDKNGQLGPSSELNFTIEQVFWKKTWFVLLSFLLLTGLIILYFRRRLSAQQAEQEKEMLTQKRMKDLEFQALSAMMNPHFVFNSLNSIQYFFNSNDREAANNYLTQFASLIRMNLNRADQAKVSLEDELERLELYLKLEQMRLGDKFDYVISMDESIEVDLVQVPSMVLQPYVENSILHGISLSDDYGKIDINIESKPVGCITISITDNGVGLEASKRLQAKKRGKHKSKGMQINAERIKLLSANGISSRVDVDEVLDDNGVVQGTRVKIVLPDAED